MAWFVLFALIISLIMVCREAKLLQTPFYEDKGEFEVHIFMTVLLTIAFFVLLVIGE